MPAWHHAVAILLLELNSDIFMLLVPDLIKFCHGSQTVPVERMLRIENMIQRWFCRM
jgi:hypothetical protein